MTHSSTRFPRCSFNANQTLPRPSSIHRRPKDDWRAAQVAEVAAVAEIHPDQPPDVPDAGLDPHGMVMDLTIYRRFRYVCIVLLFLPLPGDPDRHISATRIFGTFGLLPMMSSRDTSRRPRRLGCSPSVAAKRRRGVDVFCLAQSRDSSACRMSTLPHSCLRRWRCCCSPRRHRPRASGARAPASSGFARQR